MSSQATTSNDQFGAAVAFLLLGVFGGLSLDLAAKKLLETYPSEPFVFLRSIFGVLIFLLPVCAFLAWNTWDFVAQSWAIQEASREPGGLPYPFVPLLKSVILLMPVMVALQGLSLFLRSLRTVRGR